jgi:hypothetical protein
MEHSGLNRREALRKLAASGIGSAIAVLWVDNLAALARERADHLHVVAATNQPAAAWAPRILNAHQHQTVAVLAELIIPQTDTPGAKGALVDRFIDATLAAAEAPDRDRFIAGLAWLDKRSLALYAKDFVSSSPAQQTELLTAISTDASAGNAPGREFFTAIKSMTITGYYTSEVGLRVELGDDGQMFLPSYEGCTHPEHQR